MLRCKSGPSGASAGIQGNLDNARMELADLKRRRAQQAALCPNAHDKAACWKLVGDIDDDIKCTEDKVASYEAILGSLGQAR
eukprot:16447650-Heterocapsa_arctica.AAC.1